MSEDCLFLDVYAPYSAFESGAADSPVVVWFYGGAFIFGSKGGANPDSPLYTGTGLMNAAQALNRSMIFVAGNYRLGAFGWLAGPTMETKATANAGFYDQQLLLQWVQDNIAQFGGDKTQVSAWGESAGAGSILHHIIQDGGSTDPLFRKAFMQSPAFEWQWDRNATGTLEQTFNNFTTFAKCSTGDFDCLITQDYSTLQTANQQLGSLLLGLPLMAPNSRCCQLSLLNKVSLFVTLSPPG